MGHVECRTLDERIKGEGPCRYCLRMGLAETYGAFLERVEANSK